MSTLTDSFAVMNAPLERRFYPRVAPLELVHIAVGPHKQAALLNLSENGLLVSAPHGLAINSVHRVSLSLSDIPEQIPNSIPNSINVHVLTIWTAASQKIAGLQFLDLSETDRDQIRKWAELQSSKNDSFESWTAPKNAEASPESAPLPAIESQGQPQFAPALKAPPCSDISLLPGDAASQEISSLEIASCHDASAVRTTSQSSAPVLIFWGIALATILVVTGWAAGHNLSDKLLSRSAQIQKASAPVSEAPAPANIQAAVDFTAAPPASASSEAGVRQQDVAQQDVEQQHDAAESATADNSADASDSLPPIRENSTIEAPATKPYAKRKFPRSKLVTPNLSASSTRPSEPQAPLSSRPSVVESIPSRTQTATQMSTPPQRAASSQTAATSPSSASSQSLGTLRNGNVSAPPASPNTAGGNEQSAAQSSAATQSSANASNSFPQTLSVDKAIRQSSATATASNSTQANSTNSNDFAASKPTQRAPIAAPGTVFPSASAVDSSADIPRASSPTANNREAKRKVQPDARPEPSISELPASGSASFVNLPGEHVLQSPGVTMHVQRSVWVRAGHWFWRGHRKVALGALSSRVDPQPPRSASPSGTIAVQATIDEEGYVTTLKPLYGSLDYLPNVSRAIRDWRYQPTYVDNKPVETLAKIEVNFHSPSARSSRP
jgi:hypothetical protein